MKTCRECSQCLPLTEFYANPNTKDGRLNWCKPCLLARHAGAKAERSRENRRYFQQIKVARGCADCGYNANPVALDFDHRPGTVKLYRIACMAEMRRELIDAEIAKCDVVCANCHRIRTNDRLPEPVAYIKPERYRRSAIKEKV